MPVNLASKSQHIEIQWYHWKPIWDFVGHHLMNMSTIDFHDFELHGGEISVLMRKEMYNAITEALGNIEQQTNYYRLQLRELRARHGNNYTFSWEKLEDLLKFIETNLDESFLISFPEQKYTK